MPASTATELRTPHGETSRPSLGTSLFFSVAAVCVQINLPVSASRQYAVSSSDPAYTRPVWIDGANRTGPSVKNTHFSFPL